jgi:hypothetical protein
VFEAGERQSEVVEPMIKQRARDADTRLSHIGEIGQAHSAGPMLLPEDDVLIGTVHGPPAPDTPLQRAAHARPHLRMAAANLIEHSNRTDAGRGLQHRHELGIPDIQERIRSTLSHLDCRAADRKCDDRVGAKTASASRSRLRLAIWVVARR